MDVILAKGATVPSAHRATTTIPIVFVSLPDPIVEPPVGSLSHPVGNITGFTTYEYGLVGKRLSLLRDLSPRITRVLYLRSRQTGVATQSLLERVMEYARTAGLSVTDAPAQNPADIEREIQVFASSPDGGLLVAFDAFTGVYRQVIVETASRYRLPAVDATRNFAENGGLCSYGFDQDQQFREAALTLPDCCRARSIRPAGSDADEVPAIAQSQHGKSARSLDLTKFSCRCRRGHRISPDDFRGLARN